MVNDFFYSTEKYVLIGKVTKAHGIKGELKIVAFSGQLQSIIQYRSMILVSKPGHLSPVYNVIRSRLGNKEAIVHFNGVTNRDDAEKLCGHGVLINKHDLPSLDSDEFYLHELENLLVMTEDRDVLGRVESFLCNGAQDILVVVKGNNEYLIPLIPGMIIERNKKYVIIAPPPGLLEINSGDSVQGDAPHGF